MVPTSDFLERLRSRISIADVASRWVKWDTKKTNASKGDYWGLCPFHEEINPSFHVEDKKGFYYCFGCHEKGTVFDLLQKKQGIDFSEAVRRVAFITGMDSEIIPQEKMSKNSKLGLLEIKEIISENFTEENFLEVGILTGWTQSIRRHPRLLRSLNWGDPDFPGCVLDILTRMDEAQDGSIAKLQTYIESKFSGESLAVTEVTAFSNSKRSLGYNFVRSRNDVIGVMMPFGGSFAPVYEAIKASCNTTKLPAKRADEVWNSSVLINDILELINHSAVVVCDLTGRNENVFYELGIAHAWGKTVIPITQSADDVPFDLKHHRYLRYLNNAEGLAVLQRDLSQRLQSLVGERLSF